jgi:hypothetical protein
MLREPASSPHRLLNKVYSATYNRCSRPHNAKAHGGPGRLPDIPQMALETSRTDTPAASLRTLRFALVNPIARPCKAGLRGPDARGPLCGLPCPPPLGTAQSLGQKTALARPTALGAILASRMMSARACTPPTPILKGLVPQWGASTTNSSRPSSRSRPQTAGTHPAIPCAESIVDPANNPSRP